jgi:hypothetical protein
LLFDENLAPRLAYELADVFPGCTTADVQTLLRARRGDVVSFGNRRNGGSLGAVEAGSTAAVKQTNTPLQRTIGYAARR